MTDSVVDLLGIDKTNMDGKLAMIEEMHGSNASFLVASIVCHAVKKECRICLILLHNTFSHYQNVCIKYGCNLSLLKEQGKIVILEPMKIMALVALSRVNDRESVTDTLQNILSTAKNVHCKAVESELHVVTIIDDFSHFPDLGVDLKDALYCIRYLRSLVEICDKSQLYVVTHTFKHESQSSVSNLLAHFLKSMAQLLVMIEPLETGYSSHASGKVTVNWKADGVRAEYNWPEIAKYTYKLSNRHVQISATGLLDCPL